MKKITIIGAGIAGLTTAISLIQKGFEVTIFETTPQFKKAGSGINLAINAMQVYKRLGIYDAIIKKANYTDTMNARTSKFKVLSSVNFKDLEQIYGVKNVAIHRAVLHEILLENIGETKIHLNKKLKSLSQENGKVTLFFKDGTEHISNVVIGADGIHSNVRKAIFSNTKLRDAQQVCWRGISTVKIDDKHHGSFNELFGKGNRFGFVHISKTQTYWYALINKNRFTTNDTDLQKEFVNFHPIVNSIIEKTPKEDIIFNEIWDLNPIKNWHEGNVCLVGDSAHATTPNLGQGAVQAIESAYVLANCLSEENDVTKAFQKYQTIRYKKANFIVKTSWRMGKIAQSDNGIICIVRDFMAPLIPKSISLKQQRKIFDLNF